METVINYPEITKLTFADLRTGEVFTLHGELYVKIDNTSFNNCARLKAVTRKNGMNMLTAEPECEVKLVTKLTAEIE